MAKLTPREWLLEDLCSKLGFCSLGEEIRAILLAWEDPEVDDFAEIVFEAEGLARPFDRRLYAQVREMISRALERESGAGGVRE